MSAKRVTIPLLCLCLVLTVAVGSQLASADDDETSWKGGAKDEKEAATGIEYPGVDPQKMTGIAPLIKKAKKSKKTVVTWPGFQMVYGGSRVFVQMVKGTKVDSVKAPKRVTKVPIKKLEKPYLAYEFPKKVVLIKNNLNPLITRAFNTPVDYVRVTRKKGKVYMIVKLRVDEEPVREEMVTTEAGYNFFFIEFGSGDYLPEGVKEEETSSKKVIE